MDWTLDYRTATDDTDPGPLMDAVAELARREAACIVLTDPSGEIVLDLAPDGDTVDVRECKLILDGHDTDGSTWSRCTTHDQLVYGEPEGRMVCEGYRRPPYLDPATDDERACTHCGDTAQYLSSRNWCDGCELGQGGATPFVVINAVTANIIARFFDEQAAVEYIDTLPGHEDGLYGLDDCTLDAVRDMPDPRDDALDQIAEILRGDGGDGPPSIGVLGHAIVEITALVRFTGRVI